MGPRKRAFAADIATYVYALRARSCVTQQQTTRADGMASPGESDPRASTQWTKERLHAKDKEELRYLVRSSVHLIDAKMVESDEVSLAAIAMYENRVMPQRDRIYDHADDARKIVSALSDLATSGGEDVFRRVKATLAVHLTNPSDDWERLRKIYYEAFDELDSFENRARAFVEEKGADVAPGAGGAHLKSVRKSLDVVRRNLHLACITVVSGVLCASKCLIVKENKRLFAQRRL